MNSLISEVNFFLRLASKVEVEPLSELTSLNKEVVEIIFVERGEGDDKEFVVCQANFGLELTHLSHLSFSVMDFNLFLSVGELRSHHLFLLVEVTILLFPVLYFVEY